MNRKSRFTAFSLGQGPSWDIRYFGLESERTLRGAKKCLGHEDPGTPVQLFIPI